MAGVTVLIEHKELSALLTKTQLALANPTPMFNEMGEALLDIHRQRFRDQVSPDGQRWEPLRPWYQEQKSRNKDKILTLTGFLSNNLRYQINGNTLLFGTNAIYGAVHQFGATIKPVNGKALNIKGRLVSQVVIPARPWLGLSTTDSDRLLQIAKKHIGLESA